MISFRNSGPQIDTGRIAALETAIGCELPTDYKTFLLTDNGGSPNPDTIDIAGLPGSPTDIQVFFGVGPPITTSNLSWNIDLLRKHSPNHRLFPVAGDSGGGIFCLDLFEEFAGGIVYCDLSGLVYEVAPSFETFLKKIRPFE